MGEGYTAKAMKEMEGHKAKTGGQGPMKQVKVVGKKMWLWNVMDSETRYILAAHLTPRRDCCKSCYEESCPGRGQTAKDHHHGSYWKPIKEILPEGA